MSTKKSPKTPAPKKNSPTPEKTPGPTLDTLAQNRGVRPVDAGGLPQVPTGFAATPFEERRQRLRLVPAAQHAELLAALREAHARRGTVAKELGEFAPDVTDTAALADRIDGLARTVQALNALRTCHEELEDLALSDAIVLLEKLHAEFRHRKDKIADLAGKYPRLDTLFTQRAASISEGIAKKKGREKDEA